MPDCSPGEGPSAAAKRPLVVSVVGTRPEAIKMKPVVRALAARRSLRQEVVLTGQHGGLEPAFGGFPRTTIAELALDPAEHSAGEFRDVVHDALCRRFRAPRPDLVLVQGDTTSALAGALAARDCRVPLGHVEAGLRSHDLDQPWPEEGHRIGIDRIADLLFAPNRAAAANLAAEGVSGSVLVTGNSGIDAVLDVHAAADRPLPLPGFRKTILVTCHRRENRSESRRIAAALKRLVHEHPVDVLFLLHMNAHVRRPFEEALAGEAHVALLEPVGHEEMVALIDSAWLILTDSGGLQEEGPALGRPVLVLRNVTERAEANASMRLVGTEPGEIVAAVAALLADEDGYARMAEPSFPFGDGHAAPRIAEAVEAFLLARASAAAPAPAKLAPAVHIRDGRRHGHSVEP